MLVIKEIFGPTIQGDGVSAGAPIIVVSFAGCNVWDGSAETKRSSICPFCDADFQYGDKYTPREVCKEVMALSQGKPYIVVFTGGEPLLQRPAELQEILTLLNRENYAVHLETNGTMYVSPVILSKFDHITCSPKVPIQECKIPWEFVDCIKLLAPHPNVLMTPESFAGTGVPFKYLQPIQSDDSVQNTLNAHAVVDKVKRLGMNWAVSIRIHKILGEP